MMEVGLERRNRGFWRGNDYGKTRTLTTLLDPKAYGYSLDPQRAFASD
jgi:hypothetical protein